MEQWKEIPGFPAYQASNEGRIKRVVPGRKYKSEIILKFTVTPQGYHRTQLSKPDHTMVSRQVGRLVLETFVGPCPPDKRECNHKDGKPNNNRISNLEWVTSKENKQHALYNLGWIPTAPVKRGQDHGNAKLTDDQVREIKRMLFSGIKQRVIAARFGVIKQCIGEISRGASWKHI